MIEVEIQSGIATVSMRHGKVNAMDIEFCRELIEVLDRLASDDCRAVILTGNDRVFSAGVDLVRLTKEGSEYLEQFLPTLIKCFKSAFAFPKPMVAAINGHAIAGGCILATACDIRVTHDRVRIGIPELRVGVPLPSIAIEVMRLAVANQAFRMMVNVGRNYRGEEAMRAGLADRMVEREGLMESARLAAVELLTVPPSVFAISKRQLRQSAMSQVEQNENSGLENEIFELWRSEAVSEEIERYVTERL